MYKYLLLIFVLLCTSCATKRKTKEVDQVNLENDKSIKNDSSVNLLLQKSTYDFLQNYSKNETLLQKLGLTYAGKTNEDKGKVSLKQTKDGLELDIQGAIAMALDQAQQKNENLTQAEMIKLMDSIYTVKIQQDLVQREQRLIDYFKSNTEKEKNDVSIWIYVVVGGILCLVICLGFVMIQINHIKKYSKIMES